MNPPPIRTATARDRDRVVAAIVLAFIRDPVARWVFAEPHRYVTNFPRFIVAFGGRAFERDTAHYSEDFSGAALWLPPGVQADENTLLPLLERTVHPKQLPIVHATLEQMGTYHPAEPHWYLPLIGVDPAKQGHGNGAALLRYALERVDREGRAAYLESSNPANIPLYQRHGFEVVGTIQVEDAPPLFPMVRHHR